MRRLHIVMPMAGEGSLMLDLAARLSAGIPFLRVDFYEVDHRVYFGELTFFHHSGFVRYIPE